MVAVLVINEVSNLTYLNLFSPTPQIIHLYFKRRDRMVSRSVYILIALRIFCIRFLFGNFALTIISASYFQPLGKTATYYRYQIGLTTEGS